jgi:hypothetical protein
MFKKTIGAVLMLLLLYAQASAQNTVTPQTFNASGGTNDDPTSYYRYEWSVGESTTIQTLSSPTLTVTAGVLQPGTNNPAVDNTNGQWTTDELKVFPNPVITEVEVDVISNQKGKLNMKIFDASGRLVAVKTVDYFGTGQITRFDMRPYSSGNYTMNVTLEPLAGSVAKKGSFKLVKLNN